MALEVRDADLLIAHFYTLDCATYTLQEIKLPQQLTWWQGLEDAHQGKVYIHGYADRQLGQHKGILALEATTGKPAWESTGLAFYGIVAAGILAYPATELEADYTLLDAASGKTMESGISQLQATAAVNDFGRQRYSLCQYPVLYKEGETYFEQVRDFLNAMEFEAGPVQALEYAETENCFIISFYIASGKDKLKNILLVYDLAGEFLLQETLGCGLSGIGSDTFFIFGADLYFIQNRDILKAYQLLT
nr:DUF4905 domain-containing protein [Pontibacter vulgaris]